MRSTNIACDGCGHPIEGEPGFPRNTHLMLSEVGTPTEESDVVYAVYQFPKLEASKEFHNFKCLTDWIKAGCP